VLIFSKYGHQNNAGKESSSMNRLRAIIIKLSGLLAALALAVGVASAGAICILIFHQPKIPEGMRKFTQNET